MKSVLHTENSYVIDLRGLCEGATVDEAKSLIKSISENLLMK